MRIALLVEGETERAFLPHLREFLRAQLAGRMPKLAPKVYHGRVPKGVKLKRQVEHLLTKSPGLADKVIALTDVYTGTNDFVDASDAKSKMAAWVNRPGDFFPHAAQHDFEAWLLPYWDDALKIAKAKKRAPGAFPEQVNHMRPPSQHFKELFAQNRIVYDKIYHANQILLGKDLMVAINACPELKALVNTILGLCGGQLVP